MHQVVRKNFQLFHYFKLAGGHEVVTWTIPQRPGMVILVVASDLPALHSSGVNALSTVAYLQISSAPIPCHFFSKSLENLPQPIHGCHSWQWLLDVCSVRHSSGVGCSPLLQSMKHSRWLQLSKKKKENGEIISNDEQFETNSGPSQWDACASGS